MDTRISEIEKVLEEQKISYLAINHFMTGPKNKRVATRHSYVQFASQQCAESALAKLGGDGKKFTMSDHEILLKPAIDSVNQTRNASLRNAAKAIKQSPLSNNFEPKIVWNERSVKLGNDVAFSQKPNELTGTFEEKFAELKL